MRTPTLLLAAGAAALLLAACTDEQTLDDFLDPVEESDDDTPDNADDDADDDSASDDGDGGELEVDADAVVLEAYAEFLAAADAYDVGEVDLDALAALTTEAFLAEAQELWMPFGNAQGGRSSSVRAIVFADDDRSVAVTDCIADSRYRTVDDDGFLESSAEFELHATELVDDGAGGWLVDRFSWVEGGPGLACVPQTVRDALHATFAGFITARLESVSRSALPDLDIAPVRAWTSNDVIIDNMRPFNEDYADHNEYMSVDSTYGLVAVEVNPDWAIAMSCLERSGRAGAFDADTDEFLADVTGSGSRVEYPVAFSYMPGEGWRVSEYGTGRLRDSPIWDEYPDICDDVTYDIEVNTY